MWTTDMVTTFMELTVNRDYIIKQSIKIRLLNAPIRKTQGTVGT